MNRRTLLTVSTAACLCGMYESYAVFVSPLFSPQTKIGPGDGDRDRDKVPPKPPENRRQAEKHLSDQAWANDSKYQFRTEAGFFYFQEWEKIEQTGKIRFQPFAMIWRPKGSDPLEAPYTIVSDSALVEFAEKFEIKNPHPGRVVGGALEGKVRIRGPKDLSIDGQNFNFAEKAMRIWSDHKVAFQQGPHTGRGQGLELDLIPATGAPDDDKPAVTGVRTVRLRKDVQMELVAESKTREVPGEMGGRSNDQPETTVFIDSAGNFEYDIEGHVATFQKNVHVKRPTGGGQSDVLECELLTLIFEPEEPAGGEPRKATESGDRKDPETGFGSVGGNLAFRRLRAEGPVVTVVSQRSELQARMNELTYDAQARVIVLSDARQVRLVQRNNELLCPEINAILDESGDVERAFCRGAGKLFRYGGPATVRGAAEKRKIDVAASWQKQLQKIPDLETGLDLIEFEGRAVLNRAGKESLQADVVRIWVTPRAQKPAGAPRRDGPASPEEDEAIQPRRMLALREVAFASPKITGQTERLEVWFDKGALLPPPIDAAAGESPQALRRQTLPGNGLAAANSPALLARFTRGETATPAAPAPARGRGRAAGDGRVVRGQSLAAVDDDQPPAGEPAHSVQAEADSGTHNGGRAPDLPLAVTADVIRVRTVRERDDEDPQISEVITEGRVHVTQEHKAGEPPLDLTGDRLHMRNYSETNQVLDVTGRPAHVQDRGMHLEGPEIHFDRGSNFARVQGAGVLRRPVARGLDGKPLDTPQMLDVFWKEKMEFDGEVAKFYDTVRTQLNGSEMRCDEMNVTFNRRISFTEDGGDGSQDADIRYVVCRDGVELKSHEYEENRLVGVRTARGFEFTIDQRTGRITGQGPGTLAFWRRGNGKRAALGPHARVRGNGPLAAESAEWEYTRINFAGNMMGNTKDRVTTFHDRVRVVYGPVSNSTQTVDEDNLPKDGGWMDCNVLQLTQHPEKNDQKAYIEMEATGNTVLDGRSFHAMAQRVTYDESKGLYVLYGDGKRYAKLWHERAPGAERSSYEAQQMSFIPSRNYLKIDRSVGGQGFR